MTHTTTTASLIETLIVRTHRAAHPASRAVGICRHGGGATRKRRVCNICGEGCPGYSGSYPRTKRSIAWEAAHVERHLEESGLVGIAALAAALAQVGLTSCEHPDCHQLAVVPCLDAVCA